MPSLARRLGRVCAEAGRDVALLPGLPRAEHSGRWSTQRSVEPLPHVDDTRGARFFAKLDLAVACMRFRIQEEDRYTTSFRVPGGQPEHEFRVGAFGLPGVSSVLMRFMRSIFGRRALQFDSTGRARPAVGLPGSGAPKLGRCGVLRRRPHLLQGA